MDMAGVWIATVTSGPGRGGTLGRVTETPTRPDSTRSIDGIATAFAEHDYVSDRALATVVFLGLELGRPILLEGRGGCGQDGSGQGARERPGQPLIRLQCYEGLDVTTAVYEWNYPRQMLEIRLREARGEGSQAVDRPRHLRP